MHAAARGGMHKGNQGPLQNTTNEYESNAWLMGWWVTTQILSIPERAQIPEKSTVSPPPPHSVLSGMRGQRPFCEGAQKRAKREYAPTPLS